MIDKETYKKELIRMFASFRHDKAKFEYCLCSCEQCDDCPLLDCCHMHGTVRPYDVFEVIERVEKWSKENPPKKNKVSQVEYDILKSFKESNLYSKFHFMDSLVTKNLIKLGYFEGADEYMKIKDYFDNCEVIEDDDEKR